MLPKIILASASPARKKLLLNVGITPDIVVSHVDEEALVEQQQWRSPEQIAGGLAIAKAEEVARHVTDLDALIIGCDSVMEFGGHLHGKPGTPEAATARLKEMSGGSGFLHTGHHVIRITSGVASSASAVTSTQVVFNELSDAEVEAYVATSEPLHVAGAYTIDSLGGVFIREIHGDPSNVVGLSLPTLRGLFAELGVTWDAVLRSYVTTHD
jgi:septum formation protein